MKRETLKNIIFPAVIILMIFAGCSEKAADEGMSQKKDATQTEAPAETLTPTATLTPSAEAPSEKKTEEPKKIKMIKRITNNNPLMVQRFGADPYALVYDGRVYIYMTGDSPMYDGSGKIRENDYSNICTINVISSPDLVNWTDHGTIYAAGPKGAAKWGKNSWAPAVAYKNIDGKDKFFLYFANGGNGIAVLVSDSPTGPFTDPIGKALISRSTPNCANVTWLFDPAVLVDDDGQAYIYFGGGIPGDKAENPGTARVAKLSEDMTGLVGDPVVIENVPFLFEDSGINKINGKYIYSYCSNFSMTPEGKRKYGFDQGQIITMVSDDPMGPFELSNAVLKNPGNYFGLGGNNHHCIFEFKGEWYITYHARLLEAALGFEGNYRSTNIDKLKMSDGLPVMTNGTREGAEAVETLDPYMEVPAVTLANAGEIETVQYGETAEKYGSGDMILTGIHDGSFTAVYNADFGEAKASKVILKVRGKGKGTIRIVPDTPASEPMAVVTIDSPGEDFTEISADLLKTPEGVHKIFFLYTGEGYEILSWKFE